MNYESGNKTFFLCEESCELRVRKNGRVGRGEGRVCRKEVGMCFLIFIAGVSSLGAFGTLGNTILLFSLFVLSN